MLCVAAWLGPPLHDGVAIRYTLPVLRMTSSFHIMGSMGRQMGTTLCSLPAPVDVVAGRVLAAAANWLAGSTGRLAGVRPLRAGHSLSSAGLGYRQDGGTRFAM